MFCLQWTSFTLLIHFFASKIKHSFICATRRNCVIVTESVSMLAVVHESSIWANCKCLGVKRRFFADELTVASMRLHFTLQFAVKSGILIMTLVACDALQIEDTVANVDSRYLFSNPTVRHGIACNGVCRILPLRFTVATCTDAIR